MLWLAFVRALPQTPRLSGGDACAAGGKETFPTSLHSSLPGEGLCHKPSPNPILRAKGLGPTLCTPEAMRRWLKAHRFWLHAVCAAQPKARCSRHQACSANLQTQRTPHHERPHQALPPTINRLDLSALHWSLHRRFPLPRL